jgi:2-(1,2-epoxy-1,2-dihydrophenyl)acetyl-CoA isomerase
LQGVAIVEATVKFELRGDVAWVTLNRPDTANTINLQLGRDLLDAATRCRGTHGVRAVVITGAGKAFSFGGDLGAMMMNEGGSVEAYLRELTVDLHAAILAFNRLRAPVIAAVNGTAAGAGMGIVAMADLAIAAQSARFSLAYTAVGLTPDGGTSYFLPRALGTKRAMELVLTNRQLSAAEALDWGLVNQVVADADLLTEAGALATRLAAGPLSAFGHAKRLMRSEASLEAQLEDESRTISSQATSPEAEEGIGAFLGKRKPTFPR